MNSGIAVYNEFRGQLAELKSGNAAFVFDYESPKGNKEARSHVYKLRQTKAAVDKARKEEKAASLEYGKKVDAEAKEIIGEIEQMIAVHQTPLDEIDSREAARKQRHIDAIDRVKACGSASLQNWMITDLSDLKARQVTIESEAITESAFEEFTGQMAEAKDAALIQIREAIAHREKYDRQQAEIEAARLAAAEAARKHREEQIAKDAADRAVREVEARAKAERDAAESAARKARDDAARKELELRLQAEQAERRQLEAEQRAKDAEKKATADAKAKADREAAEAANREANRKHAAKVNNEILAALLDLGISEADGKKVVSAIAKRVIPHVSISY